MNIFTHYNPVPQIDQTETRKLLSLWESEWKNAGFSPVILESGEADMQKAWLPFDDLQEKLYRLPTVNPRQYSVNTFIRWLAMSFLPSNNVVVHVDSDVFPALTKDELRTQFPKEYAEALAPGPQENLRVLEHTRCPCAVSAKPSWFRSLCFSFLDMPDPPEGCVHFEDQEYFRLRDNSPITPLVSTFPNLSGPWVHYPTQALMVVGGMKDTRHKYATIKALLEQSRNNAPA